MRVRVEGAGGTLFDSVRTVGATTFTDSRGASFDVTTGPTPLSALALAARLGGFPFLVKDYGSAIFVDSANDEVPGPAPDYDGWMFRLNGSETKPGNSGDYYSADSVALHAGDEVLWYYGAWDASPTVARPSSKLVRLGQSLKVTAEQLDQHGVASPLAGAVVRVGSRVATSAVNGAVSLPMTAVGDYGVRVEKAGCIRSALVTVHVRKPAAFAGPAASAAVVPRGSSAVVSAVLSGGVSGLAGKSVRLWHRTAGTSVWVAGQVRNTRSAGAVRFTVAPSRSMYYRFAFAGDGTYAPCTSASKLVTVAVR